MHNIVRKIKNKKITYSVVTLLIIGLTYIAISWIYHLPPFHITSESQHVNLKKTDTEKSAIDRIEKTPSEKNKNNQTDQPDAPSVDSQTGLQQANVLVTSVDVLDGSVRVSGFVSDIVEDGGVCTYIFTNGSTTFTKESTTLPSPTSISCRTLTISVDEFPSVGSWNVSIRYKSDYSTGTSSQRMFKL